MIWTRFSMQLLHIHMCNLIHIIQLIFYYILNTQHPIWMLLPNNTSIHEQKGGGSVLSSSTYNNWWYIFLYTSIHQLHQYINNIIRPVHSVNQTFESHKNINFCHNTYRHGRIWWRNEGRYDARQNSILEWRITIVIRCIRFVFTNSRRNLAKRLVAEKIVTSSNVLPG